MDTLYISDLDGTLLNADARLSPRTTALLRERLEAGVPFTVATARTAATVTGLLRDLPLTLPVVLMNGAVLYDMQQRHYLQTLPIEAPVLHAALSAMRAHRTTGFVYTIEQDELHTYYDVLDNDARRAFVEERTRIYHKPFTQVLSLDTLIGRSVVYISMLDSEEKLRPLYESLQNLPIRAEFYADNYSPLWFLELCSANASKRQAAEALRTRLNVRRLVGFGDNLNDLPMFAVCDEAYAVANAREEVKAAATGVIGANTEDGVAVWLQANTSDIR